MENLTREVHALSEEVVGLRADLAIRNKWLKRAGVAVTIAILLLGLAVWKAYDASWDADRNADALAHVVEENRLLIEAQEDDRDQVALLACQNRNSGQRSVRDSFDLVLNLIIAGSATQPPSQRTLDLLDQINSELAKTPDRDCNGDDAITEADYLDETASPTG